jgi:hypothetical protein
MDGTTGSPVWLWSGDRLMDLNKYQALRMKTKTVDGNDYLFIEAGEFSTRNKLGWKPKWLVLSQ